MHACMHACILCIPASRTDASHSLANAQQLTRSDGLVVFICDFIWSGVRLSGSIVDLWKEHKFGCAVHDPPRIEQRPPLAHFPERLRRWLAVARKKAYEARRR
eukprot:Opistho-2@89190